MPLIPSATLMHSLPRDLSVTLTDLTVHLARSHGSVQISQAARLPLQRGRSMHRTLRRSVSGFRLLVLRGLIFDPSLYSFLQQV
jgi:hypothetical protein